MANDKDFILKNAIEVGGSTKVTIGDAPASGSVTVGYDLSVAAYDSKSFSVNSQEPNPRGVTFKPDGTKMYVVGDNNQTIFQYSLDPAWDVSTASYDSVSKDISSTSGPYMWCLRFNPDGTKMYTIGQLQSSPYDYRIYQYTLSSGYDLSTATYDNLLSLTGRGIAQGFVFNDDGSKFYLTSSGSDELCQYSLTSSYDVTSATYDSVSIDISGQTGTPSPIAINSDGTKIFVGGGNENTIFQYNLSTAYDLSSAAYSSVSFLTTDPSTGTKKDMVFKPDGTKVYVLGPNTVYQYSTGSTVATATFDTSTGNYFTHTPSADAQYGFSNAGDVQTFQLEVTGAVSGYQISGAAYDSVSFSVNSQNTNPLDIAFNNDGTKMYIMGNINDTVLQYSLSTGFDLSTASYDSVSFATTSQDTNPRKLSFNTDGTKMYIFGTTTDTVYQYSLSTAFDLSTTSYDSVSFNAASQSTNPKGLTFNSDGTKMYLGGGTVFYQYSLSTAFDLSTTSYDSVSFSVSSQESSDAPDLTFNNDGTKMYVVGATNDSVYQYSLSTAFDLSTASYDSVSFSVASQDAAPNSLAFSNDGSKMYVVGNINDTVYQYSTGSAYTITWDADIEWGGGTAPSSPAANQKDLYTITTDDGGTTYFGVPSGVAFS